MCKEKNITEFFDGTEPIDNVLENSKNKSEEYQFLKAYKTLIEDSKKEANTDYDPFARIKTTPKRYLYFRKYLPYAASILLLITAGWIFQQKHSRDKTNLTEKELKAAMENTNYALNTFSSKLHQSYVSFEKTEILQKPLNEMVRLKSIKIKTQ